MTPDPLSQHQVFDDGLWYDSTPLSLMSREPVLDTRLYVDWAGHGLLDTPPVETATVETAD